MWSLRFASNVSVFRTPEHAMPSIDKIAVESMDNSRVFDNIFNVLFRGERKDKVD